MSENLIDRLYPEDTHTRRMWLKYDEMDSDTTVEDRKRILAEMKAMQISDEKERGRDASFDASVFWGVIGTEYKDLGDWKDAEECYRKQLDFLSRISDGRDSFSRATSVRSMSYLIEVMGRNTIRSEKEYLEEIREIWDTAKAILDDGWDDEPLMDMDDLYWLVRRKEFMEAGITAAISRSDDTSALVLSHEFLSGDAEIPTGDSWYGIYTEILDLALLELRLSEEKDDMDKLIDGIKWLDDNADALLEHAKEIEIYQIPHLVHYYALAGGVWRQAGNSEKNDRFWTHALEFSKEIYREGEALTLEGLKSHIELFRIISDRHRENGEHKESYALELELEKLLSQITPHLEDSEVIGERVSNGMYLGSYSEDLKEYDRMLGYWTEALSNLMDVEASSSWAENVLKVLTDHWKNAEDRTYDPEKLEAFKKALDGARKKFDV